MRKLCLICLFLALGTADRILVAQDTLAPVPASSDQARAEKEIKNIFKKEYGARTLEVRKALALKLLESGKESVDDKITQFVLLKEACDNAATAGDIKTSFLAIEELAQRFTIRASIMKHSALGRARKTIRTVDGLKVLSEAWLDLIDEAITTGDFKTAQDAAKEALRAAGKTRNVILIIKARRKSKYVSGLKRKFDRAIKDVETLENSPKDPQASLSLGRFFCFEVNRWELGLPLLEQCSDDDLKAVAGLDRANPSDPKSQVTVGNAWLQLAQKRATDKKNFEMKVRARYWYEMALRQLTGLEKVKTEKRILEEKNVYKVILWNTHNWDYRDRGALECAVTFLDQGGSIVGARRGIKMKWIRTGPSSSQAFIQCKGRPSKLGVEITKCYLVSAGLAEIELFRDGGNIIRGASVSAKPESNLDSDSLTDGVKEATGSGKGYWYSPAKTAIIEIDIPNH